MRTTQRYSEGYIPSPSPGAFQLKCFSVSPIQGMYSRLKLTVGKFTDSDRYETTDAIRGNPMARGSVTIKRTEEGNMMCEDGGPFCDGMGFLKHSNILTISLADDGFCI